MVINNMFDNFYSGRRVLITGHTGFKGSWLAVILRWLGAEVLGYALQPNTDPSLFEAVRLADQVSSVFADIRDYDSLLDTMRRFQPEIIIHMAAQPIVRESYRDPRYTYEVNVMGTVNLLEAARSVSSVRAIVNVTTDKCYENREWCWGYRESDPLGGYDPYSCSKACSELVTASYRNSFLQPKNDSELLPALATARAGNVLGGGDWAEDRLIPDFIRAISQGRKVIIRNPGAIRPWQNVLEPLFGYLLLSKNLYQNGGQYAEAWNFGPDDNDAQTVEWMIEKICSMWGGGAAYSIDSSEQPHEAGYLKLDCSKAKNRLGWRPLWTVETALQKIVEWNKAYQQRKDMLKVCLDQIQEYAESMNKQGW